MTHTKHPQILIWKLRPVETPSINVCSKLSMVWSLTQSLRIRLWREFHPASFIQWISTRQMSCLSLVFYSWTKNNRRHFKWFQMGGLIHWIDSWTTLNWMKCSLRGLSLMSKESRSQWVYLSFLMFPLRTSVVSKTRPKSALKLHTDLT